MDNVTHLQLVNISSTVVENLTSRLSPLTDSESSLSSLTTASSMTTVAISNDEQLIIGVAVGVSVGVIVVALAIGLVIFVVKRRSSLRKTSDEDSESTTSEVEDPRKGHRRRRNAAQFKADSRGKIIYHTHTLPTIREIIERTSPMMTEVLWEEDEPVEGEDNQVGMSSEKTSRKTPSINSSSSSLSSHNF